MSKIKIWTKEKCLKVARDYKTRKEWRLDHKSCYVIACKNGWLKQCTKHMKNYFNNYTFNQCKEIALKYKGRTLWQKGHQPSYRKAWAKNWLDKCCRHMIRNKK